jgi:MFS family permease
MDIEIRALKVLEGRISPRALGLVIDKPRRIRRSYFKIGSVLAYDYHILLVNCEISPNSQYKTPISISHLKNPSKIGMLILLSLSEMMAMGVWFSASAVVPVLTRLWHLDGSGQAWLTMSVQIGFVVGALGSAVFNLADRVAADRLLAISSVAAGLSTAFIPIFSGGLSPALFLRFLSGMFLAGVYPVGMKLVATWTKNDRGLGIGLLVGAITVGSAFPHLLRIFGNLDEWKSVLYIAAFFAILGGLIAMVFVRPGPYSVKSPPFNWRYAGYIFRNREILMANLGYLGHMWELYAMWTWVPIFMALSFSTSGSNPKWVGLWAFLVIAIGGLGSAIAGRLADRLGRTTVTIGSLVISGLCCLIAGLLFGRNPTLLVSLCLVWGFAVVADSAQFSACISELAQPEYIGTALTLQTSLGFLLTLFTIRLLPNAVEWVGWQWAFSFLMLGPIAGIWAMAALRRSPSAVKLANGRR